MGRNAGGVNGGTLGRSATERGYTAKMMKNIVGTEDKYAKEKIEYAHTYTEDGEHIFTKKGGKDYVNLGNSPENSIVTHNHPLTRREAADKWLATFSTEDLNYAVNHNLKEMRVRTKFHTFSMRRVGKDWGEKAKRVDITNTYKQWLYWHARNDRKAVRALMDQGKYGEAKELQKKFNSDIEHRAMKDVAKYYGWNYTIKKE